MVLFYHKCVSTAWVRSCRADEKIRVSSLELHMLEGREDQRILLALPNTMVARATELCRNAGCRNVFVFIPDNGFRMKPIRVDVTKPRLDYVETELSRVCNLHCRGCSAFIQLADKEPPFYDPEEYKRDLRQLKTKFWGVEKIRLLGGEPLLLKEIAAYTEWTRSVFPDADIRIVTNGLLIPSLSAETLSRLKTCGCSFDISNYPPTARHRKEIISVLRNAGVGYDFGPPMIFFLKNVSAQPSDDPKPSFDNCLFNGCHMLTEGGILSPCSFTYCIRRFNRHFGTDYPENDCINLYQIQYDGWQIQQVLSGPHPFCRFCAKRMAPIRWKNGVHAKLAKASDWIVPANVWTDRIIPSAQHLALPVAKTMRRFVQRKK